jgi:protocatechuate 3,4-dioxygenase beta subunit
MRMLLFLALFFATSAQPAPQVNDGVIEVTVRDSVTRAPIPGARITFIFYQNPPPNVVSYVTADESGQVIFKDLAPGNYGVDAAQSGYIRPIPINTNRRQIGPETKKHQVEVALTRGSTLTGRVLDANGIPVAEASVTLATATYREGRRTMARAIQALSMQTDDRGDYRIMGITPGDYYLQVELRSSGTGWSGFWDSFPRVSYYPGVVDAKTAALVTVRAGQDLSALDIRLPSIRTFKVSGVVVNPLPGGRASGNGQTYRQVSSYYLGSADPDSQEDPILMSSELTPSSRPDESIFELAGIAPGSYFLYPLWDPGTGSTPTWITSRTPIQVNDRDLEGLKIVLKPNGEIKGRVVVEGNTSPAALSMVRIGLRRKERLPTLLGGTFLATASISNPATGEFTMPNVPDARFGITVPGLPPDAYVVDVRQGGRSVFDEGVMPSASGSDMPIEITLNLQGGTVQGVVRDAAAAPLARAGVTLVPAVARRGNPQFYKRVATDASGQFKFTGIAPGEYRIFGWSAIPPGQAEENALFLAPFETRGTAVTVSAASPANVQLTVIPLP